MKCPNCNSKIHYRDSVQRPDGTDVYRCTSCETVSKARHGFPFFLLVFAIIVPLGSLILVGIVESIFSSIWTGGIVEDDTVRIVSLAVSVILFVVVFRILNKLERVEEVPTDSANST